MNASTFHTHLDMCGRCANKLFELCPTGERLLREIVDGDPVRANLEDALRLAVYGLDEAAGDDRPTADWTAAKWRVFHAAIRLVKEGHGQDEASGEAESGDRQGTEADRVRAVRDL